MDNLALQYLDVTTIRDISSSFLTTFPSRTQDPYLINFLVAVDTEIIIITKRQPGLYTPDGPLETCNPLLPPFFNGTTNETYPNPAFPACQSCSFLADNINGTCKDASPKMYPWIFYDSLRGMLK